MPYSPTNSLAGWSRALVVIAHPDDESFGLGAVLGSLIAEGCEVNVLCFTHGEASTLGASVDLAAVRATELRDAAAELGIADVTLDHHPDGSLDTVDPDVLDQKVRDHLDGVDLLVVFEPGGVTGHRDHCAATAAAVRITSTAGIALLEWGLAAEVAETLKGEFGVPFTTVDSRHAVSITVDRTRQRRAIARHATQSTDNPVLRRRLALQGDQEVVRLTRAQEPRMVSIYPKG